MDTHNDDQEKVVEEDDDGGWVDTHHFADPKDLADQVSEMTIEVLTYTPAVTNNNKIL